jgi:hypothetical protein
MIGKLRANSPSLSFKRSSVKEGSTKSLLTGSGDTSASNLIDDEEEVFFDCQSEFSPRHLHNRNSSLAGPQKRTFPLTLAKNLHFYTVEEFKELKKTNPKKLANSYSEPPAGQFQVRGPDYLSQGGKNQKHLKLPSLDQPYELIGLTMYRCPRKLSNIAEEIQPLKRFFASQPPDPPGTVFPTFLMVNWIVAPLFGQECHVCCHTFRLKPEVVKNRPHLTSAFQRFRDASDAEKNSQFKWYVVFLS